MFWKTKTPKGEYATPEVPSKRNLLKITLCNGDSINFWKDNWEGEDALEAWACFIGWFLNGETPNFFIKHDEGGTMVRRVDIQRFTISVKNM